MLKVGVMRFSVGSQGLCLQVFETFSNCLLIPKGCHYYSMIWAEKSIKRNPEGVALLCI
jgi:hypothetical protein